MTLALLAPACSYMKMCAVIYSFKLLFEVNKTAFVDGISE